MEISGIESIGAVVLAAGQSRRMQGTNKLLSNLNGRPLISHALATLEQIKIEKVIVVGGLDSDELAQSVTAHGFDIAINHDFESGIGTSIATGVSLLPSNLIGCFVVLADMPFVKAETYLALANSHLHDTDPRTTMSVPVLDNRRGHPVLFGQSWFAKLKTLEGDQGARELLRTVPERIKRVEVADTGIFEDIDTPGELAKAAARIKTQRDT